MVLLLGLLLVQTAVAAQRQFGLQPGQSVLDMRWRGADTLVCVMQAGDELAIEQINAVDGSRTSLELPRSLQRSAGEASQFSYALAPLGNALAVVERSGKLVGASRLAVYRIEDKEVLAVATYRLPMEFWPGAVCWDEAGENLFMAARPYLQPRQMTSLAVFRLSDSEFIPLLQKNELDIIRSMAFLPGSGELAVLCSSRNGEYPAGEMLVLVNPDGNRTRVVHGRAGGAELQLLDNGDLLLGDDGGAECWIMPAKSDEFRVLPRGGLPEWGCQVSRDGNWLAGMEREAGGSVLLIQQAGAEAWQLEQDCSAWRFNHDGSRLAVHAEGTGINLLATDELQ